MRRWLIELLGGVTRGELTCQLQNEKQKYKQLEEWVRETELETLKNGNRPARFLADRSMWNNLLLPHEVWSVLNGLWSKHIDAAIGSWRGVKK